MSLGSFNAKRGIGGIVRGMWLSLAALAMLAGAMEARAANVILSDGNSTAAVDTQSSLGLYNWFIDGVPHLNQDWLWYRIGSTGEENPLHIGTAACSVAFGNNFVSASYTHSDLLCLTIRYDLMGGPLGSAMASLKKTVTVVHLGAPTDVDLHLFHFADVDVDGEFDDNTLFFSGGTANQTGPGGSTIYSIPSLPPDRLQAALFPDLVDLLSDEFPDNLSDFGGPVFGDAQHAMQWDRVLQPGQSLQFSITHTVPEPSLAGFAGLGACAALLRRKRAKHA